MKMKKNERFESCGLTYDHVEIGKFGFTVGTSRGLKKYDVNGERIGPNRNFRFREDT